MADAADYADRLNLREQIARIDRSIDEASKLRAETDKLHAKAGKFRRERTTLALTSGAAILGAGAVIGGLIVRALNG